MRAKKPKAAGPLLEIQIHPSQIRRGVKYFFLDRRQVGLWLGAAGLMLGIFAFGALSAPWVVASILRSREYESLLAERAHQGQRLQLLNQELAELGQETDQLHLRMSRIYLAYGLDSEEEAGQGGYPFEAPLVPDSVFAGAIRHGQSLDRQIRERMAVLGTFWDEVRGFEDAHADRVRTTPSRTPLRSDQFVLTSPFGNRRSPFTKQVDFHPGLDMAAATGTPIYAPADGTVAFAGRYPVRQSVSWWRYGNLVALRNGERFITLFGHCDEVKVRPGQKVKQGDVIATVGNTGWSTSPHLHYEVRARGAEDGEFKPVDPRVYILDHRWSDEEEVLVRGRRAPSLSEYEPLPRVIGRVR